MWSAGHLLCSCLTSACLLWCKMLSTCTPLLLQLASLLNVPVTDITNVIVWGNHASSQFPYGHLAKVKGKPLLQQDQQHQWQQQQLHAGLNGPWELEDYLRNEFITIVQNRGIAVGRVSDAVTGDITALGTPADSVP